MTAVTTMSAQPRRPDGRRRVLIALTLAVALLAVGAFTLSFDALKALAVTAGLNAHLAWVWPLIVDGFIVIATATAVMLRDRGWRVSWYPWATLIVFAAVSVAGNALHASSHADRDKVSVTVAALVSAVPAIALLLASHLLVVLLSPHLDGGRDAEQSPKDSRHDRKVATNAQPSVKTPASVAAVTPTPQRRELTAAAREHRVASATVGVERTSRTDDEQTKSILEWAERRKSEGSPVTGEALGEHLGFSAATGRRRLRELKQAGQLQAD